MSTTARRAGWRELREAALSATRWGWPVVPGTFLCPDQRWYGRDDASRLGPIADSWRENPITDPAEAYEVWSEHPYSVLLVCGRGMDALELPQRLRGLLAFPKMPKVSLAMTAPPVRWLLFTATGSGALSGELASAGMRLHTAGAWIALPPTTVEFLSPQRWLEPPNTPALGDCTPPTRCSRGCSPRCWPPGSAPGRVTTISSSAHAPRRGLWRLGSTQLPAARSPGRTPPYPHRGSVWVRENQEAPPAPSPCCGGASWTH